MTTTETWRELLRDLLDDGERVGGQASAGATFKGGASRELIAYQSVVSMSDPVVRSAQRELGYRFMAAEAAWILSGDNRLATIEPYAKAMRSFTDDGYVLAGSYGPPFVDQLSYVVEKLHQDPSTRQAVTTIWRPRPGPSKDTPCTVALQWLLRDEKLNCVATMRSSDAMTGIPYDWHTFSAMSAYVALHLSQRPKLGWLHLVAGSQHLYESDVETAKRCVSWSDENVDPVWWKLDELTSPDHLIERLWELAKR